MHFLVGNNGATEAMTILNSGNVGIGTAAPGSRLDVTADQNALTTPLVKLSTTGTATITKGAVLELYTTRGSGIDDTDLFKIDNSAGLTLMTVRNSDKVGIGTASPAETLTLPSAGKIGWEASAGVVDTNLYRSAADTLKTDDALVGASTLTVGTAGGTTGAINFNGTTSGTAILTVPAAAGTPTLTLPTATGTLTSSANNLSVFAATTSAQLAGVLSDETGSGLAVFATTPVLNHPTIGIVGTAASSHVLTVGTAPTCAFSTGGGSSPSCALQTGSTDHAGTMILTTGNGSPSSAGTVTLTFNGTMGTNSPVCVASLTKGAVDWSVSSTVRMTTFSTTAPVFTWNSQSATALVNLTASTAGYDISYICYAK